jgi:hypothetical protein
MPLYKCEICNYSTKLKPNFDRHKNTKKHQEKINEHNQNLEETNHKNTNEHKMNTNEHKMNTNEHNGGTQMNTKEHKMNTKTHKCDFCEKLFNTHASKRRHEKRYCRENPDMIAKKDLKIKNLEKEKADWQKEKEKLYEQVSQLIDKVGDTNIQNNIILNNFGSEDLSHLTDTFMNNMIGMPYGAIPKMIEMVHFNAEKPENKNIMLPNKKENLLKVFQGNKWVLKNKNETITDLVDSKYNIIDGHFEKVEDTPQIAPHVQTSYQSFRKFYDDGDAELINNLKKECELVLLNNRD